MPNLSRVSQLALAKALNGDTGVADALGNVMNGSAMNAYDLSVSNGTGVGVYAQIGTLNYLEFTIVLTGTGSTVSLPFTHQSLSSQYGVIPGVSASGVAVNALVPPGSSQATLYRFDGSPLTAGTYYFAGTYESDIG